jgi:hypothetical protein
MQCEFITTRALLDEVYVNFYRTNAAVRLLVAFRKREEKKSVT